jgi:hypothetical protein
MPLMEAFDRDFMANGLWQREHDLLMRGDNLTNVRDSAYAEQVYFHPFVQRFLYGETQSRQKSSTGKIAANHNSSPMRLYSRKDIKTVWVNLEEEALSIDLAVERIHFYLFDHGVAILVVEVRSKYPLALQHVEELLDRFRRAYPPYW